MKTRTLPLIAVVVVALTAGCGSADSDPATGGPTVTQSSTEASSPADPGATTSGSDRGETQAVTVSFRRSGGLKPTETQLVYSADSPPPAGTTKSEVASVLQAASDPELQAADMTPVPKDTCCDRQEYSVTITYADGSSESFRSLDGLQQPQVFEDLLSMLG